ncbi:hypothetical protein FRB93_008012 [Tulasnella sp. JGI-2019a]|nr:hypothetical protein FRB93_008012 [Tulasnella sp. JGI-2019a]
MNASQPQSPIQGSPPEEVNEQKSFGEVGDFWTIYGELADTFDDEMIKRLNESLDVLLIFAGLFSAVDTAFIVVALNALSAAPADQTNHLLRLLLTNGTNSALTPSQLNPPSFAPTRGAVRQNCFFFASLGFSLLAAAGAVLAKQWLHYYQRTGQTGPIRKQAMRRTKKFIGAEAWKLAHTVEALPVLILISLAFFSAALVDYLWAVDRTVAIVVSALAASGFLAWGFTVVAGIISGACPFQTSFAKSVRKFFRKDLPGAKEVFGPPKTLIARSRSRIMKSIESVKNNLWRPNEWSLSRERSIDIATQILWSVGRLVSKSAVAVVSTIVDRFRVADLENVKNDSWLFARSVIWMAETAPEEDNILVIAQNIPFISDFRSMQLIAPSAVFPSLLWQFRVSINALHVDRTSSARADKAVTMARAVSHVALADPVRTANALGKVFLHLGSLNWLSKLGPEVSEELMILLISMSSVLESVKSDKEAAALRSVKATLRAALLSGTRLGAAATTHLHHCVLTAPCEPASWEDTYSHIKDISGTLLLDSEKLDTASACCAARALSLALRASPALRGPPLISPMQRTEKSPTTPTRLMERAKGAWVTRTEIALVSNLQDVIEALSAYYSYARTSHPPHEVYEPLLLCHKQLLVCGSEIYSSINLETQHAPNHNASLFQQMHQALNVNFEEFIALRLAVVHPSHNLPALHLCHDELVGFLRNWLLIPGPKWYEMSKEYLGDTARLASLASDTEKDRLSEAILYRYFVHVQRDLYSTHAADPRHSRLSHDREIGPVLVSTLRLFLWLYPSVESGERRIIYEKYLRCLATGRVEPEDMYFVGWMFGIIPHDPGIGPRRLQNTIDPKKPWRKNRKPTYDDRLAQQVDDTMVDMCRPWDLDQCGTAGSCMLWLAESFHRGETWARKMDKTRITELFIGVADRHGSVGVEGHGDVDIWSRVAVQAAGALFLRAWDANHAVTPNAPSDLPLPSEWVDADTIKAFAIWLRALDGQRSVAIKEESDNVVFIQTPVDFDMVSRFLDQARDKNLEAVKSNGLDLAPGEFVPRPVTTSIEATSGRATLSPIETGVHEPMQITQKETGSPVSMGKDLGPQETPKRKTF